MQREYNHNARAALAEWILACLTGDISRILCEYCRNGWPLNEHGQHEILGILRPCAANEARNDPAADPGPDPGGAA